jgi:hypothetical protein
MPSYNSQYKYDKAVKYCCGALQDSALLCWNDISQDVVSLKRRTIQEIQNIVVNLKPD